MPIHWTDATSLKSEARRGHPRRAFRRRTAWEGGSKHFKMTFWAVDMYIASPAPDGKILINASIVAGAV